MDVDNITEEELDEKLKILLMILKILKIQRIKNYKITVGLLYLLLFSLL